MANKPAPPEGPFSDPRATAREGLDQDTKGFLDVARLEAEGYTDEQLETRFADWNAGRLDALETAARAASDGAGLERLRRLILGCTIALALALVGVGLWTNSRLEAAQASAEEIEEKLSTQINGQIVDASGAPVKVATGRTCAREVAWTPCTSGCGSWASRSGNVLVDTSSGGFEQTPAYYVSISGSGSWEVDGLNAIYDASPSGFKLYIRREDNKEVPERAKIGNWCVSWVGIGK